MTDFKKIIEKDDLDTLIDLVSEKKGRAPPKEFSDWVKEALK